MRKRFYLAGLICYLLLFFAFFSRASAGSALQFDGANGYVQVPHNAAFNTYPFTVTAWIRSTNFAIPTQGIVSKYMDSSGNGWSLVLQGGRLRGFYYHSLMNYAIDATVGAITADGFWHHVAMTIDASGGKLYVDGIQAGASAWVGPPGAPTGTQPVLIGRYDTSVNRFVGDIDEVALWNRSLNSTELNYLKYRPLHGDEDGLIALYHFDENSGSTASDATGHGFTGTLISNPAWIASSAPIVFNQVAGDALKFDGDGSYVTVAHTPDLNAYPLTASAWFRSTSSTTTQGIVNKYLSASGNGWAVILQNGSINAWYYPGPGLGSVYTTSAPTFADGNWHHVAFTVDASSGKLYVDGSLLATTAWNATPAPPTTTAPLQIGEYTNNNFYGDIDEVSVWNRALANTEVTALQNQSLTGHETNLLACWHFNEGSGTTTADASSQGHNGSFVQNPAWTGSTARLGDGTSVIYSSLSILNWLFRYAVQTIPAHTNFESINTFIVQRLDDFGAPTNTNNISASIQTGLRSANSGNAIPLVNSTNSYSFILPPFNAAIPQTIKPGTNVLVIPNFQPAQQIDSVNDTYQLSMSDIYSVDSGPNVTAETQTLPPVQLMDFNGNLYFGDSKTIFNGLSGNPLAGALGNGGLGVTLPLAANGGMLASKPDHTFGGVTLSAVLLSNGDAISTYASPLALSGPAPDSDCVQNICFQRSSLLLTTNGASGSLAMQLPFGFSISPGPTNHVTLSSLNYSNTPLDGNLLPTNSLTTAGPIYAIEETLPYWFAVPSLTWQVAAGQIVMNPSGGVFVRQGEDDFLAAQQAVLTVPESANRVSNDGLYRNATAGGSLIVTADANGAAQVTTQIGLAPPELRPHFPYAGQSAGAQISTGTGVLNLVSNLPAAGSYLNVIAPVPVTYGRDCTYIGCSATKIGPATLPFTAINNQLNFTPDGGLLAYGSVPTTSLTWGYANGTNFAQTAGSVSAGAFCIAGTFLRADQSTLDDSQRPAALLFSGFGDASNPAYVERLDQAGYADGFANYPGLNFRSPGQGLSYLAQETTGAYPLNPVSKYYVRAGGVNGIHQAASFPASLKLYGYSFTFTDYGLSYLDGQNYQSVTTGAISFPSQPAGFTQTFDQMTVTCRGDLASAKIPAGSGSEHLAYWDVDFTPESIDFHPTNDDTCGLSPRFLALGVETKLPFIPQKLEATLGFKPNGNLVTVADNVMNVDSRFAVPGQLSVQGPGTTLFTLSTATEGYFNNWETPGAANLDGGFYVLAGKLSVPFFTDIKVQLHVTPTGPTTSEMNMMGGWPAADSTGPDLGWSLNSSNYFNLDKFDPHADGWPIAVSLANYRSSPSTQYRPRAQRDWIEVASFDYPLQWNNVLHNFTSFQDSKVVLPVIDVNSRLKELAPGKVDLDFAQDISLQLPQIKVLDIVNDGLNGNIGPLLSISNAIRSEIGQTLDATGLNELSQLLREDSQTFFNPVLSATLDPANNAQIKSLFDAIAALPQTDPDTFLSNVYQMTTTSTANPLKAAIQNLNGQLGTPNSVVGQVGKTLSDVQNTVTLLNNVLARDSSGNRHVVRAIIKKLVSDQGPALGFVASLGDDALNPLLSDLDGSLDEIQSDLQQVGDQLAQINNQLNDTSGDFTLALSAAVGDPDGLTQFVQASGSNLTNYLASVLTPAGDYFTSDPAAARAAMLKQIQIGFLSSPLAANYQKTFKQFLYDKNFALDQLMNTLFDQINRSIRNGLSSLISGAQDGTFQNMKGGGLLSGSLLSAQIKGEPTFDGDSLREIHLDAALKMNLPDEMNFNGYMDILELNSQSMPVDCIPAGAPAAEITIGTKDVPLEWAGLSPSPGSTLLLDLEARWTLQSGNVIGLGGSLNVHGKVDFEACSVTDIGATLAIGQIENYFAAKAAGTVTILGVPVAVQAGVFAGHACTLDPLKFIDPDAQLVLLDANGFSGIYVEYGGGLSLSQILFQTSSCMLDVEANTTTAIYYEGGPRFGTLGGRQKMGVDVSLLCVVSGHVDWSVFTQLTSGQLTLGANADVCGSIGECPFCVSGCKSITVIGTLTTGGIDYSIDY